MGNWCVYMHINKVNGKKYIGITGQNPEKRWLNGKGYKNHKCFYKAIQKYSWDMFEHIILHKNISKEEACKLEKFYTKAFNTKAPTGYNLSDGGEGNSGWKMSETSRQRLREIRLGQKCSEATRQKIIENNAKRVLSEAAIANIRNANSHPCPPEIREKIRKALTGKKLSQETKDKIGIKLGRIVICDGEEYPTVGKCAEAYGIKRSTMTSWLNHTRPMRKDFVQLGLKYKD